jgi:DNA-binding protein H-NS
MKRAEEYRKKAEGAEATRDPNAKQAYLEIAQQWRQLAEHAEHMER